MEMLYLDNFRGFSDQFIEIRNVNFLVGENSSGKSSVLMVLNSISSPGLWFNVDFYSGDAQAYSFEDLVSVESEDKTNFQIGNLHDDDRRISFLFNFENFNGKPTISSGIIEKDRNSFIFYNEKGQIKYKVVKNKKLSLDMLNPLSEKEKDKFKNIKIPINTNIILPVTLLQMCEYAVKNKESDFPITLPFRHITPIAPIRSKPKKTYDEPGTVENPEGDHIPYEIRRIFKINTEFSKDINNFGTRSGMFKKINIKEYGNDEDTPFRMNFVLNKKPINIVNIGYGISQVLPILYNMYMRNNIIITIQQPEVHLHPKAQAALGNVFFDLSIGKKKKKLIIETHSDYIIDRFRQKQRKSQEKPSVHLLFFLREKGINKIFPISIDENGNYDTNQPKEFREFFIKEELENLGLQS
jgi:hypothetical protein